MSKPCRSIKDVNNRIEYYFANARREITEKNLTTLRTISVGASAIGLFLGLIAPLLVPGWVPTVQYEKMVPTMAVFMLFSFIYKKREHHNYYVVQVACILFYVLLMYHFMDISIFSYPDMPDTYVCLSFMMIPVLFIIRPVISIVIMGGGGLIFGYLVRIHKTGIAVPHDRFAIVATFFFAAIIMYIIFALRMNDFFLRERYMRRSRTDQLTGLLNKRSYERSCQEALKTKPFNASCALIIFDIDGFKGINDNRGHIVGDRALEIIGEVLTETFRASDYVGRIGGDEFSAFVLPGSDDDGLYAMAQRVLDVVAQRTEDEIGQKVTLSVGIALREKGDTYYEKVFIAADSLLYNAKDAHCGDIRINKF